jgi:hypothetical protein
MSQKRKEEIEKGHTRFVQWNVVCRCALILGIIPDYSKGSTLKVAEILKKQIAAGKVVKQKEGEAQSDHAFYAAKVEEEGG